MSHSQICEFIERWTLRNRPDVCEWNYEENTHRSIDVPHVHVFLRFGPPSFPVYQESDRCAVHPEDPSRVEVVCSTAKNTNKRSLSTNVVSDDDCSRSDEGDCSDRDYESSEASSDEGHCEVPRPSSKRQRRCENTECFSPQLNLPPCASNLNSQ